MKRLHQALLIGTFLPFSWLAMMASHEFGHCAGALATGATVSTVVLHPLLISRTDVKVNPHPLFVAWMGPIVGVLLPLVAFAVAKIRRLPGWYLVQFFAGFCLIANGLYIGVGSFQGVGDAGDMLHHGSSRWTLWICGVVTAPTGLGTWHGLGPHFGLGIAHGAVNRSAAYVSCLLLVLVVTIELVVSQLFSR